jgi:single-strand DNA-binding protein
MRLSTIAGEWRLGFDPELRYTPNGKAICTMRAVANDRQKNRQTDEWEDVRTTWVNLEVWGPF